jgi:hypothetical protein
MGYAKSARAPALRGASRAWSQNGEAARIPPWMKPAGMMCHAKLSIFSGHST